MTTAQDLKLDYFNFYDVANQSAGYVVGLQGQFDKQPEQAQVTYLNLFANPASKNGEPMYDKNAHLSFYNLYDPTPDPTRQVTYEDQFGKQEIYIGRAYGLLVPTQKSFPGSQFPRELDHYKVYQVLHAEPAMKEVSLEDQFGKLPIRVYMPRFFAVPVRKWYQGQTYGVNNATAHLNLYQIYPTAVQQTIATRDQFSQRHQIVFRSVLMGAPCKKLDWKEV